jgi:hypothetical protein
MAEGYISYGADPLGPQVEDPLTGSFFFSL